MKPQKQEKLPGGCIIAIIIGIICLIAYCSQPSDEEIKEKKEVALRDSLRTAEEMVLKKQEDSVAKIPIKKRIADFYSILNKSNESAGYKGIQIEKILKLAKGNIFEKRLIKSRDSLIVLDLKADLIRESYRLKSLEPGIRNLFLDSNLDIQVLVTGKYNTTLKLTYALFNDVWFRRFDKEGWFSTLSKKGFKKIILTDGYSYEKWVEYN